jgi:hypothetical protein
MIIYEGEKTTANQAAKQLVFNHGASVNLSPLDDMGIDSAKLTEREECELARLVDKHIERTMKLFNI